MTTTLRNFHEKVERTLAVMLSILQTVDQEIDTDPNLSQEAVQLQECLGKALRHNEEIIRVLNEYLEAQR